MLRAPLAFCGSVSLARVVFFDLICGANWIAVGLKSSSRLQGISLSNWMTQLPFVAIVGAAATTGVIFAPGSWYASLNKPRWTPPDWLFGPAWAVLYIMIAIAGWLAWSADGFGIALAVWGANIIFNAAWSWLMFGRHRIGLAFLDAMAMLITIVAFIIVVKTSSPTAALLFIPYLGWVVFATALNFEILQRNGSDA